jgi:hypothetical protein
MFKFGACGRNEKTEDGKALSKALFSSVHCPPQYLSIHFGPVSGLMSGKNPNLHLPMHMHSGVLQILNSFTVAGAVRALFE